MSLEVGGPIRDVWVDVTFLVDFHLGRPTGIPRTMRQICSEWLEEGYGNLRFCCLRPELGGYVEVSPRQVLAIPAPWPGQRGKESLRRLAGPARACLPPVLFALLQRLTYQSVRLVQHLRARCRRALRFGTGLPVVWSPRDLLVMLGVNWTIESSGALVWKLKQKSGFRMVSLIYDLIPFLAPHYLPPGLAAAAASCQNYTVRASDLVIVISEHTRSDLWKFCELRELSCPAVEVVRLGENLPGEASAPLEHAIAELNSDEPFVLSVGSIEVRKNHLLLYQVWARLAQEYGEKLPRLVIAGAPGWAVGDLQQLLRTDPRVCNKIVVLSGLDDRKLSWLYRHCLFTMYPSFYEGWGLPIAESLNYGKYCIASNSSSMPEIGGALVGMHDPCDWKACTELVRQAVFDPTFRALREKEIRTRYRRTSWRDCVSQFRAHIEKHFGPSFLPNETIAVSSLGKQGDSIARPDRVA